MNNWNVWIGGARNASTLCNRNMDHILIAMGCAQMCSWIVLAAYANAWSTWNGAGMRCWKCLANGVGCVGHAPLNAVRFECVAACVWNEMLNVLGTCCCVVGWTWHVLLAGALLMDTCMIGMGFDAHWMRIWKKMGRLLIWCQLSWSNACANWTCKQHTDQLAFAKLCAQTRIIASRQQTSRKNKPCWNKIVETDLKSRMAWRCNLPKHNMWTRWFKQLLNLKRTNETIAKKIGIRQTTHEIAHSQNKRRHNTKRN